MSTDIPVPNARERVYDFPNGFLAQAQSMYGWLLHERFSPEWDSGVRNGSYHYGITLPSTEVPALRALQRTHPSRWGNHPDQAELLAQSAQQAEASARITQGKLSALTPEQREWL